MNFIHHKITQAMAAFSGSFFTSLVNIPEHLTSNNTLDDILKLGQIISVWFLLFVGCIKFMHYLNDRKKNAKNK